METYSKKIKKNPNPTQNASNHDKGKQKHTGLMATRSINDPSLDPEEKNGDKETERERMKKGIISAVFLIVC